MSNSPALERLSIVQGDITKQAVDAIVNAANESLLGGGGVDGAIHRGAGPELLAECQTLGGCPTGAAKITRGYRLPAKQVIHTVGPVWHGDASKPVGQCTEDGLLASCYRHCLALAEKHGLKSIAFPSVSTGVYRFPVQRAARIALGEIEKALDKNAGLRVTVVCFDQGTLQAYQEAVKEMEDRGLPPARRRD